MTAPEACPEHEPVQNRDGRPPWCRTCGRTADGKAPVSSIRPKGPKPLPPVGARVAWKSTADGANWRDHSGTVTAHEGRTLVVYEPPLGETRVSASNVHVLPAVD